MKNSAYIHQRFYLQKTGPWLLATETVNEPLPQLHSLSAFRLDCTMAERAGWKKLIEETDLALYLDPVTKSVHVIRWRYYAPGYEDPETRLEWVINKLSRAAWGWQHVRCVIARFFGFDWQAGRRWPHRVGK